jgi:uncharacterized protein (UPF0332 family)
LTHYEALLEKAERYIHSAEVLAAEQDYDSAASRLYYAMFYVAQALLESQGQSFSSHRAVISAYGQHFAKSGELDPRFHKALLDAFSQRQLGDYTVDSGLGQADIEALIIDARSFVESARNWLSMNEGAKYR